MSKKTSILFALYTFIFLNINLSFGYSSWDEVSTSYFKKNNLIKLLKNDTQTPIFITDTRLIEQKVRSLKKTFSNKLPENKFKLFYAVKANFNPQIIQYLKKFGVDGIETVSPYEVLLAKRMGFNSEQIIFTGNNIEDKDIYTANQLGAVINIGSIGELKFFAQNNINKEITIRINPGFGDGEFNKVVTGGHKSKFGISNIDEALQIIKDHNIKLIGLHCHIGSGLYNTDKFYMMVDYMFNLASKIDTIKFIDLGGGLGVRYKKTDKPINIDSFATIVGNLYKKYKLNTEIILEPGKYLISESTFLLAKVTNIKNTQDTKIIGLNTGFNHILRPALYSAYHHAINISKLEKPLEKVQLVGNICESTDVLADNVEVAEPAKGDIIAMLTAGAYCSSMSSLYNLRPYAQEAIYNGKEIIITRQKLNFDDMFRSLGFV